MILIKKKSLILILLLLIVIIFGLIISHGLTHNYSDLEFYETYSIPTDSYRIINSFNIIDFKEITFQEILRDFNNLGYKSFLYYFFLEDSSINFYKLFFFNFLLLIFTYKLVLCHVDTNIFLIFLLFPIFSLYSIFPNKDFYTICFSVFLFHNLINKNFLLILIYSALIFLIRAHIGLIGFFMLLKLKLRISTIHYFLIILIFSNFLNIFIEPLRYFDNWLARNPDSNYLLTSVFYNLNDLSSIPIFGIFFQVVKGFLNFFLSFFSVFDSNKIYNHFFLSISSFSNSLLFCLFIYYSLKFKYKFINLNKQFYFGIVFAFLILSLSPIPQPRYFLFLFFPMLIYLNLFRRALNEDGFYK